jgi:hypothetical protein
LTDAVINQNYFKYNNQYYKQQEGRDMEAPTSSILLEIFIQNLEHKQILHVLTKHNILNYFRYIDDIVIIYDKRRTNINNVLFKFSNLYKTLQFTVEEGNPDKINYLDTTIHRKPPEFTFDIYQKPTKTSPLIFIMRDPPY